MSQHFPVLQVVVPLLAAPLCVLLRSATGAWLTFAAASWVALALSISLLVGVQMFGPIEYEMGGWPAPFGIVYLIDAANAFVLVLVSGIAAVLAPYARSLVAREIPAERIYLFYACLCLNLAGLLGITATGDAFNVFVFLEISSLSGYALIALGRRRQALLAAIQYLVMGTVGGTFLLLGIGLAYALTGSLNMADMAVRIAELPASNALSAAVIFCCLGLAIKAAVFPLHGWLPSAYSEAPAAVNSFVSATGTKVAIYALARFAFTIFGAGLAFGAVGLGEAGLLLGSAGMLFGAAAACLQTDLRRILAYSSVSQIGYIIVGLSLATSAGVAAAFLHIAAHAVIKATLFALAGWLALRLGGVQLQQLAGLGRRMPWTFAAFVLGGLGLIGVPLTAGFISKWALLLALIEAGQLWVLGALLVSSLLAVVYVWRIVEAMWFTPAPENIDGAAPGTAEAWPVAISIAVLSALSLAIGLGLLPVADWSLAAANALLGGGS